MPPEQGEHHEEADHVGDGDVPALADPCPNRSRFRVEIGNRDAGRGSKPHHRSAVAHGVGEHAPIVAALDQRQLRQRDVVEDGRCETQPECGLPGWGREGVDRHHRRGQHQRQEEDRAPARLPQQLPRRRSPATRSSPSSRRATGAGARAARGSFRNGATTARSQAAGTPGLPRSPIHATDARPVPTRRGPRGMASRGSCRR